MDRIFIIILSLLAFTNPICWFDLHRIPDYWNNWIEFQVHVINNIIKLNYIHLLWINQSTNHIKKRNFSFLVHSKKIELFLK